MEPTKSLTLRNNLRKAGFDSAAIRITVTALEYRQACRGQITVPGGNTGAYQRYQEALKAGEVLLTSSAA